MGKFIGCLLVVAFWAGSVSFCSANDFWLKQLEEDNGLPSNNVFKIFFDRDGFLWFATTKGVFQYDGFQFEHRSAGSPLDYVSVLTFKQPKSYPNLLMGTYGGSLASWDGKGMDVLFSGSPSFGKSTSKIRALTTDESGNIHLGFSNFPGHFVLDSLQEIRRVDQNKLQGWHITEINEEVFWYFNEYNSQDTVLPLHLDFPGLQKSIQVPLGSIQSRPDQLKFYRLKDGRILLGLNKLMVVIHRDGSYESYRYQHPVKRFLEDEAGRIWVVEYLGKVSCLDQDLTPLPIQLSQLDGLHVTDLALGPNGGLWFSTLGSGLFYSPTLNFSLLNAWPELDESELSTLGTDGNGRVFLGTFRGLLYETNRSHELKASWNLKHLYKENHQIRGLSWIPELKQLWIGHPNRNAFLNEQQEVKLFGTDFLGSYAYDFAYLPDSSMLVLSTGGLFRTFFDPAKSTKRLLKGSRFFRAIPGNNDTIWLTTNDGLMAYYKEQLHDMCKADSLLKGPIRGGYQVAGELWLAHSWHGLLHRKNGKIHRPSVDGGFLNKVKAICKQNDSILWVGTSAGLYRINVLNRPLISTKYNESQGLPSEDVQQLIYDGQYIWLRTGKGAVSFNPDQLVEANAMAPIYITAASTNRTALNLSEQLVLEPDQRNLQLEFRSLDYAQNKQITYRFRVNQEAWIVSETPSVNHSSLLHGTYHFEVQAKQINGQWGTSAHFNWEILPFFWQTVWFRVLAGLVLLMAVVGLVWLINKELNMRKNLKEKVIHFQQQALNAQMNPHFIFNALNSIQAFIVKSDSDRSLQYMAKFSKLIRGWLDASQQEFIPLEKELKLLEYYCMLESLRFRPTFEFDIWVDPTIDPTTVSIPTYLIQPYVENAIWHGIRYLGGERVGKIEVSLSWQQPGKVLNCQIKDNGVGRQRATTINKDQKSRTSKGMAINNERLGLYEKIGHGHSINMNIEDLEDAAGNPGGTLVVVQLPAKTAFSSNQFDRLKSQFN